MPRHKKSILLTQQNLSRDMTIRLAPRSQDGRKGITRQSEVQDVQGQDQQFDARPDSFAEASEHETALSAEVPASDLVIENPDPEKRALVNMRPPRGWKAWWLKQKKAWRDFMAWARPAPNEEALQAKKDARVILAIKQDGAVFAKRLSNFWGNLRQQHVEYEAEGKKTVHKVPWKVMLYDWDPDRHTGGNVVKLYLAPDDFRRWPYGVNPAELIKQDVLNAALPTIHHHLSGFSDRSGIGVIVQRAGYQGLPELIHIQEMWKQMGDNRPPLTMCLGQTANGQIVWRNLVDMPHLLIAGTTDSGKSNSINENLCTLLRNNPSPDSLQLALFDMKEGVEFSWYAGLPHLFQNMIYDDPETVVKDAMPALKAEMDRRLHLIKKNYKNVKEYNLHHYKDKRIPMLVVVFDEIASLVDIWRNEFIIPLTTLARTGRAAGIHIIIATQYPKADVIPTLITLNFPARLAFHMTAGASMSVIEDQRASELVGKGRAVLFQNNEYLPVQVPYISDDQIRATVETILTGHNIQAKKYDIEQIFTYALEHFSGELPLDALYQIHKQKYGITWHELRRILTSAESSGQVFDISGTPYKVVRGVHGKLTRRLVRMDSIPVSS